MNINPSSTNDLENQHQLLWESINKDWLLDCFFNFISVSYTLLVQLALTQGENSCMSSYYCSCSVQWKDLSPVEEVYMYFLTGIHVILANDLIFVC